MFRFFVVGFCLLAVASCKNCPLRKYRNRNVSGRVRIHWGFSSAMRKIVTYARQCKVKIVVTGSFRKSGQRITNNVVKPAKWSNHFVGHAIDFNLITPGGYCNSRCLRRQRNPAAICFTQKVVRGGLRWGQHFSKRDPVHIDDGLNLRNRKKFKRLYNHLQKNCQHS